MLAYAQHTHTYARIRIAYAYEYLFVPCASLIAPASSMFNAAEIPKNEKRYENVNLRY